MKKIYAAVILVLGFGELLAQKEHYVWYFGNQAGLDFNSGAPVALTNSAMNQHEGCSSISDGNGNLLFYTDGISVWDKNHIQMPNGDSLAGGLSSTQSALIIPFLDNDSLYYIFTVAQYAPPPNNFCYSVVNMSLNSGNGDITIKDSVLISPVGEKLTAVKHANNTDIWVMVHGMGNNNFYAYLITASGITASPIISSIGQVTPGLDMGYMKFSPGGSKIAFANEFQNYVDLFDFNASTGVVSNEKYLTMPGGASGPFAYGLEFSPNGNYLYCGAENGQVIYQWDITSNSAPVINSTQQVIGTTVAGQPGALQTGPDGKIYVARYLGSALGVINNPDLGGIACNYVDNAISLGGKTCKLGLPNFVTSYFLPTGVHNPEPFALSFQIFPNPADEYSIISYPFEEGDVLRVTNVLGKTVFIKKILSPTSDLRLPTSGFPPGIYFVEVISENKKVVRKIVKQ